MAAPVLVLHTLDSAVALLSESRMQILRHLSEPDSASGVARRMGLPRQQVNYHLRELEKAGLVEFLEERRKGNCTERVMRASARSFLISPEALGDLGELPADARDRFSVAYLLSLGARLIRDLATVWRRAAQADKRVSTLALETEVRFAGPVERAAFAEELANTLAALTAKYHSAEGRSFRVIAGAYPTLPKA